MGATQSQKDVHGPGEHEDYPGQTLVTSNHEVIRGWADDRQAQPATVPGTEHEGRPGVLVFDFPGYGGENLRQIDWEEWFRSFDERNLRFIFQEHLRDGRESNFFKLQSLDRSGQ
jgi:hypothetical protein